MSGAGKTILIVEDDAPSREVVRLACSAQNHTLLEAANGVDGLAAAREQNPDLIILDINLPGMSGLDVCRRLRADGSRVPIIMLTAKADTIDVVVGLELGADDYVTKPFSPRELAARVRTVLRRSERGAERTATLSFGDVTLEEGSREVRKSGELVSLTAREFDLLWFLASHQRQVFSRDQLMDRVWGYETAIDTGTVTVHMRRLREKIEDDPAQPAHLQTVWGVGYRLNP